MKDIDFIVFNFYIPMYGSGVFYFDKQGEAGFKGIPEGTGEVIEATTETTKDKFRNILTYIINELEEEIEPENNFGCSISFHDNDTEIARYGEGVINYDKFSEILYTVINTYAEDLSSYLW